MSQQIRHVHPTTKKPWIEVVLATVSFAAICLIYFVWLPGRYETDPASNLYRPLIYAVFAVLIPAFLFGARGYAEKYGYRREGLTRSAVIGLALALPLFGLGYVVAAGPAPPLAAWYVLVVLEETYFRGLWQRAAAHLAGDWGAMLIPAVLFGVYHLTLGFTLVQASGVVLFGLLLGWLRQNTDNLLGPILLHAALISGMWFSPR